MVEYILSQALPAFMVAVVKWLTRRIVAPVLEGSIPSSHPIKLIHRGVAKSVRQRTLTPSCVGSSPAAPARRDPLAQSVEHLTFNQGVDGSSPSWVTIYLFVMRAWRNWQTRRT